MSRDGRRAVLEPGEEPRRQQPLPARRPQTRKETLLTPHEPPAQFGGDISPDGTTVYLASNKDRDRMAFARVRIAADGTPGPIEVVAARDDAELDEFALNHAGTEAALLWNVGGRNELAFVDLASRQEPARADSCPPSSSAD